MAERRVTQPTNGATFELHIDELVLHGFRPADRYAIAAAIERELGRLFTEGGVPPTLLERGQTEGSLTTYRLDAGSFDVPHDATADAIGVQVARRIQRSLGGASGTGQHATQRPSQPTGPGGAGR